MKGLLNILVGFAIIILIGYTVVTSIMILTGNSEKTFDDISGFLVTSGIFVAIFLFAAIKEAVNPEEKRKAKEASAASQPEVKERPFNPEIDKLAFEHYQQSSKTWWNDSDGDSHSRGTEYACLRFYEDGTVIAKRDIAILKLEVEDSYVYKGTWSVADNKIELNLKKVKDVNDTVELYISEEEKRNMKYAGHITHDDDLIKAGFYTGKIIGDSIELGKMNFSKVTPSRLIITASDEACDSLKNEFKDHPLVLGAFTNTGNWYTNGETGPEWFTVTFESRYELREELEKAIKASKESYSNMHWG